MSASSTLPEINVAALYRYPVKGLSPEPIARTSLSIGECVPQDRRFAVALPSTQFDARRPEWLPKTHFVMLMRNAALARLRTQFDESSGRFTIECDGQLLLSEQITEPAGSKRVGTFLTAFLNGAVEGPLRIVEAPGHAFADARWKPNATTGKYVSLINRASIDALAAMVGKEVDPLRFRANIYFEGVPAWAELGWMGADIAAGSVRLRVVSKITRCAATEVNPRTAERDLDVLISLRHGFGHNLMGVYAEVLAGGEIAVGDSMLVSLDTRGEA